MNGSREPSMEDILASIKKVIAEEKELRSATPVLTLSGDSPEPVLATAADEDGDDVLDLHEPVVEEMTLPEVDLGPPLVSQDVAAASRSRLAALQEVAASAPPGASSVNPLEAVVREMLKPILKDWLDHHLPAIVDEHVRREIMRITGTQL
jgi:cell pole-organizing protein PopZ